MWSVIGLLRRRIGVVALVAAATFAMLALVVMLMPPKYQAEALLRIDPTRSPLSSSTQGNVDATVNSETIETELSILQSDALAREVVRRLGLAKDPEFNKSLKSGSIPLSADAALARTAEEVRRHLSVNRNKLSYLIAIGFESRSAQTAAKVANTYAESYLDMMVGTRTSTAQRQADWLNKRQEKVAGEVRDADTRLAQYKSQAGIVEGGVSGTVTDQQIGPLAAQLTSAQGAAAAARSELATARQQVASGGIESVGKVRDSVVIADLRRQRAEVLRQAADLTARYGERHPEVVRIKQQMATIDEQISAEAKRVIASLEAEAGAATARVASLKDTMNSLEARQERNTRVAVLAQGLERDAVNRRQSYDRLSQMALETTQAAQNSIAQAEIVDSATVPKRAKWPGQYMMIAFAAVVAASLGAMAAILLELLGKGVQTVAEVESTFDLPVLAVLPQTKERRWLWNRSSQRPPDKLLEDPTGAFAESVRNSYVSIVGVRHDAAPQIVAVTSALPGEGKTSTALSIARISAMSGIPTLLIDCDLRRAALRGFLLAPGEAGTTEVLKGLVPFDTAVKHDTQQGLDILPVTAPHFSSDNLFGNGDVAGLLEDWKKRYPLIVLDLPPVIGLADTRFLCALADAVVLVIKWRSTPITAIEAALATLSADAAKPVGAILTMVDPLSETAGASHYAANYSAYYQSATA